MDKFKASATYQRLKQRLFFVSLFLDGAVLLLLFFSGLSFSLKFFSLKFSSNPLVVNGIYFFFLSLGFYILHFPFNVFIDFIWEHRFQLSNQSFRDWLRDDLKKAIVGFIIVIVFLEMIYFLLRHYPQNWWIGAGLFWFFLSFLLTKLMPSVIIPLFFKYLPLKDLEIKERIFQLFKTCSVPLKEVYAINLSAKTKKANAFLCGLGKNRRVVLSDTLLDHFSLNEIETVVAHELGHLKHKDILKMLLMNTLVIFLGFFLVHKFLQAALMHFGLAKIDDVYFFPLFALSLMLFGILTTPILNGMSRFIEKRADAFSLIVTQKPHDFISMMRKLGEMNLAEFKPGRLREFFFYDHPPLYKRIEFAEKFSP